MKLIVFNLLNNQGEVITKNISKGHNSGNQNDIICNFCPKGLIEVCVQPKMFLPSVTIVFLMIKQTIS